MEKISQPHQLYKAVNSTDDVLFVTHDYYENVPSKTKLMKLVAEYGKNVIIFYYKFSILNRDQIYFSQHLPNTIIMVILILKITI